MIMQLTHSSTLWYLFKRNIEACPHKDKYMNIYDRSIQSGPKLQATPQPEMQGETNNQSRS